MHQTLKTPCRYCTGEARIEEVLDEDRHTILGIMAKCTACGIRTQVYTSPEAARMAWGAAGHPCSPIAVGLSGPPSGNISAGTSSPSSVTWPTS